MYGNLVLHLIEKIILIFLIWLKRDNISGLNKNNNLGGVFFSFLFCISWHQKRRLNLTLSSLLGFWGSGEGLRPCPLRYFVRGYCGSMWYLDDFKKNIQFLYAPKQDLGPHSQHKVVSNPSVCWTQSGLPLVTVPVSSVPG